tara:strand:- start:81 stop:560 length:480 start_codon:yes stop_codon:yes gene_type:complete
MAIYQGFNIKNITLENLYKKINSVLSNNVFVTTVTKGDIFEVDLTSVDYPLAHFGITSANYDTQTLQYVFQVIVMDLVSKDESNEENVLGDTLQVIGDLISQLKNEDDDDYDDFRNDIRILDSVSCEPFTERFDNEVSGFTATITIEVNFDASACSGDV